MKIRQLLKTRKQWTRGEESRDKYGHPVDPHDRRAVRWCLFGAMLKCYPGKKKYAVRDKLRDHYFEGFVNFVSWNDGNERKFSEVKELVKKLNI